MRRGRVVLAFLVTTSTAGVVRAGTVPPAPPVSPASPTSLPLELTWSAPEECPQADAIVQRVEAILKGPPLSPTTIRADGAIRPSSPTRFELELTIRTGDDEDQRRIDATSCSALAEASAVVIALAIDRARTSAPTTVDAGPTTPLGPPPVSTPVSPSASKLEAPAPSSVAERPVRFAVALSPALDVGTLPKVAGGVILDAGLRLHRFRVGLLGSAWLPEDVEFEPVTHAGSTFFMLTGGAWGAYMLPVGPLSLGPSAGVEATFVHLEGFGIRAPASSWTSWTTVVLGVRAEARLTRWLGLTARVAMTLPIDPPTFTLGSSSTALSLHEPSVISGRFSVGPEFVFP